MAVAIRLDPTTGAKGRYQHGSRLQESIEAFLPTVSGIMAEVGADPGEPMVSPVHNIIQD